ncbi:ABC transporter ATP-binding protein [uncultured Martelella sp.]|uniref:ABC transporter ATP-binding protein n=1 Tax=uncultured Martelella sp. TaxID=392331 RepID=UPI0029C760FE|nr:ABC transporter ATP-binding protein [uncultured Martelella sp.]
MAGVAIHNVRKSFGAIEVIKGISLTVKQGEFGVFVGPSGCGKSTLLRMIAGLEETTSGTIEIEGRDVTRVEPADRGVAMVFQSYALYPHLSVFENMAFSLRLAHASKQKIQEAVGEAARILQLDDHLHKKPAQLSGGQRQRVAIGRAIVRKPKVFLFDEPLSNLDAELRVQMRLELARLHRQIGATMIYVTHDQVEAMTLASKIFVLRDGIVQQQGNPIDLYDDPDNRFVGRFIGSPAMNFMNAHVKKREGEKVTVAIDNAGGQTIDAHMRDAGIGEDTEVVVGIRPESLNISDNGLEVTVEMGEDLGGVSYLHTRTSDGSEIVVERRDCARDRLDGTKVGLTVNPRNVLIFSTEGQRLR